MSTSCKETAKNNNASSLKRLEITHPKFVRFIKLSEKMKERSRFCSFYVLLANLAFHIEKLQYINTLDSKFKL